MLDEVEVYLGDMVGDVNGSFVLETRSRKVVIRAPLSLVNSLHQIRIRCLSLKEMSYEVAG